MTETLTERRLAAVLALDVVGFSAMMNRDEMGTLRRVQALQKDIVAPWVEANRGRVFKLIGDGALAEFRSVHDSFACATGILEALECSDLNLKIRIGLHIGDLIYEDDDVFGDGVNIAARLEGVARPGTIAISERAWSELGKTETRFEDLGRVPLKNIKQPVRVYLFEPSGTDVRARMRGLWRRTRLPLMAALVVGAAALGGYSAWRYITQSPERIVANALQDVPCSWLGVRQVATVNGVWVIEIEGGLLEDRSDLRRRLLLELARKSGEQETLIDIDRVGRLPKPYCEFAERFKNLKYGGPQRLSVEKLEINKSFSKIKIRVVPKAFQNDAAMFGLEPNGSLTPLASMKELLSDVISTTRDDGVEFEIMTDSNLGGAILIVDSNRPISNDMMVDRRLDFASLQRLAQAANEGNWNVEMIWYELDGANPVASGT